MSGSYDRTFTKCTEGSDDACTYSGYEKACCLYFEVTAIPDPRTDDQKTMATYYKAAGIPTDVGDAEFVCVDPDFVENVGVVSTFWNGYELDLSDSPAGTTYKAFCAGATALQAVGAMASLVYMGSL